MFLLIAVGVFGLAAYLANLLGTLEHGLIIAYAIAFDVTITVPVAFYFLVIRPRRLPNAWIAPVCAVCFVAAYLILPKGFESPLNNLEYAAVPLELGFVAYLIWRFRSLMRSEARDRALDPLERLRRVCEEFLGSRRLGELVAGEIAMFWFLVWPPKDPDSIREPDFRFSYHRRSGQVSLVVVLLFLFAVEGSVIHYLLQMWNAIVAWIVTATTIYAGLWILADLRASVSRPVIVQRDGIFVRAGFRFDAKIPSTLVESVTTAKPEGRKNPVTATFFGAPTHWLVLREEVTGAGPYGFSRKADAVGITPDEPSEFVKAVNELTGKED